MICPVCDGTDAQEIREAYDDRYGQPDLFMLVRCVHCGHLMTSPRLTETDLGPLYGTYYPRQFVDVKDVERDAQHSAAPLARARRWWAGTDNQGQYTVRPGETMLDIGCGSGLSLLEARKLGATACGVEADPNVRRIAGHLGLQVHIGSLLDDPFPGERFDLVVLNQVIEHVPDPDLTLTRLQSRLRPGGRIVLVFPNIDSLWCRLSGTKWINWHVPYHLHHFNRSRFARMAVRSGYCIRSARTITPNLWTLLQLRAMRIRSERGTPSPMWAISKPQIVMSPAEAAQSPDWPPRRRIRSGLRRIVLVALMVPLSLVNRVVDALGWGDSLMVEITPVVAP